MRKKVNNTTNFFADPKVIIALFALAISIVSLIWTLANQWEQNRRWDKLNAANITVKEVMFAKFKELNRDEATKIQWGYEPSIYSTDDLDIYQIPYYLVVRDLST